MEAVQERQAEQLHYQLHEELEQEEQHVTAEHHTRRPQSSHVYAERLIPFAQIGEQEAVRRTLGGDPKAGHQDLRELPPRLRPTVMAAFMGDPKAKRAVAKSYVEDEAVWATAGNLHRLEREAMLKRIFPGDQRWRIQIMDRELQTMRSEMVGENPTRIVSMAADNLLMIWLELRGLRLRPSYSEDGSHPVDHRELAAAEKRYALAVKSLATSVKIAAAQRKELR